MPTHIALLRGINVGKAKRIAMADLRELFTGLGYTEVTTLLNSGNVLFTSSDPQPAAAALEAAIQKRFGFPSRVAVLSAAELDAAVAANPFAQIASDPSRFLVAFVPHADSLKPLVPLIVRSWHPEALALGPRCAYLWCPEGILASPANQAVTRALGEAVTARNWNTLLKLQALVHK